MKKKQFLFILLLIGFKTAIAQGKWELRRNENGISVYTRRAATGNLKELRVVCELIATKTQLINTIEDIGNYSSWVYSNKKSYILKTLSPGKIIYYTQARLPWPLRDRDLILELTVNPSPDVLNITVKSVPEYLPKNDDYVRVPYSLALWKVVQETDNKLKIDYTFSVDPGGNIPVWIVNATMAIGPYNSFVRLREVLKDAKKVPL
jgi:hypothetical protein